ncbi:acyl carrier protein [Hydrangea phyllody phytoplasma]|uniref:Acyl carrier protein n=8 Tax=16SrI (Aster yellows group) TaxID=3042590 RepID=ACP_ONYPE|nr:MULTISPECIES: acyl carrier protein [Phytoplasma]Q6YPI8.1 RecName: Full=Acyl carrier protein; Short=ACP [Onion yellows phytoplasma OY-M]PWV43677.1 MAG: acyl carrier protein ['Brassica napus' phytoplasma]QKX95760.1 MAG: acyl carrier protein [Rapeseed phyllody phytoplasma]GLH61156.1 acyl carrier protein [Rhus yellows phytoplasma]AOF55019.1 acyl carrier protein [Maize bushy stunt phytoplasma]MBS2993903.1 acyl carrier protein ['Santalum album' aster yellows phytoplasma]
MVFEKIKALIATQLSLDASTITLDTRFKEDLGLDSLDALELVMEVEKTFQINISDATLQNFKTVQDIVFYITKNTP